MSDLQELVLDHAMHMMLLVDPNDLRIIYANHRALQTLGYARERLLAMAITDVESALQDLFYWDEVRAGQYREIEAQEGVYQCADGSQVTVMKSIQVLHQDGKSYLLAQARDARHERQVEDVLQQTLSQLRATLESTANGILVLDWQGKITSMNRLFSDMWGLPERLLEERNDGAILEFLSANVEDAERCAKRLREIVDAGETVDVFQLKDGRVFECRSRPQYMDERIVGRVYGYHDITEQRRAEAALRESRDLLEAKVQERTAALRAANATLLMEKQRQEELIERLGEAQNQLLQSEKMASIGQLAAGVAHEINNPVGFVNSNLGTLQHYAHDLLRLLAAYEKAEPALPADVLQELNRLKADVDANYLRDDIGDLLNESLEGLQRVKRIVQDLKDFSHVDETERQFANLEHGLDSTLNVVWNELKYKAEVVKEYGTIPPIECFPSQLNQVFMNLLVNAAHAIQERGKITLRTGHDAETVWIDVEDSGCGIKPEYLKRIFEPFFTTKPVGKGTGLGLSLSYGIVQKHMGRIEVESAVGQGTRFRVTLPIRHPADEAGAHTRTLQESRT